MALDSNGVETVNARLPRLDDGHGGEARYLMESVTDRGERER